jgi:molybdopterin converting factor small subunit
MRVAVNLYASLAKYGPSGLDRRTIMMDLKEGETVAAILRRLKFPAQERTTILIEGRHVQPDRLVQDGECLHIFPPMCGG